MRALWLCLGPSSTWVRMLRVTATSWLLPWNPGAHRGGGGVPFGAHRLGTPLADPLVPQDVATLQFCANKLDKKDFFGKSDPFMVFYRSNEDGT